LLRTRERLGLLKRLLSGHLFRPATPGNVIPIEKLRWSSVRKAGLVAPTLRNGFVFDQPDVYHAPRILKDLLRMNVNRQEKHAIV
jgi:hypothetical protein